MKVQSRPYPWAMLGIAVAACASLTIGAYAIGVRPLLQQHTLGLSQRQALDERHAQASQLESTVNGLQRELTAAKEALAQTPVRLQSAVLVNQRLEAVARLATECGLSLDEMRPGTGTDSAHFQTVPIRIVGNGRYPACAQFLRNLRRTFGDMGVRTFNVNNFTSSANPTAVFQAELIWFTELPRK